MLDEHIQQKNIIPGPDEREIAVADEHKALELLAVLAAQNLDYRLAHMDNTWHIFAQAAQAAEADAEINAYEADERQRAAQRPADTLPARLAHQSWSPWWVAAFLAGFYIWLGPYDPHHTLLRQAAINHHSVIEFGEWWRLITALAVHSGAAHLSGNILALLFYGWQVCRVFGGGLGWALILGAGIAGNAVAVIFQDAAITSFGASTACFAALGIMSIHQAVCQARRHGLAWSLWNRAWIPLGAGFSLLTLMGTAPQSDLRAHLAGFFCGCIVGLPCSLADRQWACPWGQRALQMACLLMVMTAWRLAMSA